MRLISLCFLPLVLGLSVSRQQNPDDIKKFTIQMIGYSPNQHDDYVAVSREAVEGYIVAFEPMANADRVHHMLLYGCTAPAHQDAFWKGQQTCGYGGSHILYAWARNAPNLVVPKNVAFSVGHQNDGIRYFVLQVHYAQPFAGNVKDFSGVTLHISQNKPINFAAVMLFVSGDPIPPHQPQQRINMSCIHESPIELHPFAFRTHTHAMGRVVSAFYRHNGEWNKIGKRNPQWPQLFESITTSPVIQKGDLMAASCRFDSSDKDKETPMGAMGTNEMCNFYMMFYWDAKKDNPFPYGAMCAGDQVQGAMTSYPQDGFSLLPSHPELEHHAHQSADPFGLVEEFSGGSIGDVQLGQVSGLSFDREGNLIIFHRASRVWGMRTFDNYNILLDKTPIKEDTILIVKFNGKEPTIMKKLGANKFYLPHGIFMDEEGYLYTTDVGAHTVAKWKINGNDLEQVWQNGELLMPESDRTHFCKPSAVVRKGDRLYVSDGYCNSRIVELNLNGNRTNEFGLPGNGPAQFQLPHDIVLNNKGNLLVADRENGRVQELTTKGDYVEEWASSKFSNIYSVSAFDELVFMVPGRGNEMLPNENHIEVFVGRSGTGLLEFAFGPTSRRLEAPHVIRVCPKGDHVFIGDIAEGKATLWKFKIQHDEMSNAPFAPVNTGGNAEYVMNSIRSAAGSTDYLSTLLIIFVAAIGLGVYYYCRRVRRPENGVFDRKGFKPLRTEETVGFISEDSDSD